MCPAVTSGQAPTVYQAVNTFAPAAHPDFGSAALASYRLDPGVMAHALDAGGRPVYAVRNKGTATTAGAPPQLCMLCSMQGLVCARSCVCKVAGVEGLVSGLCEQLLCCML